MQAELGCSTRPHWNQKLEQLVLPEQLPSVPQSLNRPLSVLLAGPIQRRDQLLESARHAGKAGYRLRQANEIIVV